MDYGIVGAIFACAWFYRRHGRLEADFAVERTPIAARRSLALTATGAAIPVGSVILCIALVAQLALGSSGEAEAGIVYVAALGAMIGVLAIVEACVLRYELRIRAETRRGERVQAAHTAASDAPAEGLPQ
jgi:uncharacterized membrane protein YidH (DUF202 family)